MTGVHGGDKGEGTSPDIATQCAELEGLRGRSQSYGPNAVRQLPNDTLVFIHRLSEGLGAAVTIILNLEAERKRLEANDGALHRELEAAFAKVKRLEAEVDGLRRVMDEARTALTFYEQDAWSQDDRDRPVPSLSLLADGGEEAMLAITAIDAALRSPT